MRRLLRCFFDTLYPRTCASCHTLLMEGEAHICRSCLFHLPRTNFHRTRGNEMEQMLATWFPVQCATAFFFFRKGSPFQKLLHELKYDNEPGVGVALGEAIGLALAEEADFSDVDVIVPVPLHPDKFRKRGYNQSERIAAGIARNFSKPIDTEHFVRTIANPSQTTKTAEERRKNVENIFQMTDAAAFRGKHILLVDDVLTTGATIASCANELLKAGNVRISVATLAFA